MGMYLTIGIVTQIRIDKERARVQASASPEDVRNALQKHHNQSGIYNLEENDDYVWLALKPDIAEPEMIEFLQAFYKIRYTEDCRNMYTNIDELKAMTTMDEWLHHASKRPCQAFRFDEFVHIHTPYPGGWTRSLETSAKQIILSLDGKIIMECYNELFSFFTKLIRERLSRFKLADSLLVTITG